jgi:hypothetical protein
MAVETTGAETALGLLAIGQWVNQGWQRHVTSGKKRLRFRKPVWSVQVPDVSALAVL